MTRRKLPDGRAVLFERGGGAWCVRLEADPDRSATGPTLVLVLAHALGHEPVPASWPWWLDALADDVAAEAARPP